MLEWQMKDYLFPNSENSLHFIPLGGVGEIGMNLSVYQKGDSLLLVDLGFTFADETLLGIDLIVPDPEYLIENKEKIIALLVTHGHEDHIGAIPYIWPLLGCPIYARPFSSELIRQKFDDFGINNDYAINEISESSGTLNLDPFEISFINVTHSIPESSALVIKTDEAVIFHTGDWKLDDDPIIGQVTDHQALCDLRKKDILAVVGDSTNATKEGWSGSESVVQSCLNEIFEGIKGGIIVTQFASNIARLVSVIKSAHANNREVVLVGRSLWRYFSAAQRSQIIDEVRVLNDIEGSKLHRDQVVFICTGCQGESKAAMSRVASGVHPRISVTDKDTVIFSSKIIPGNEKPISRVKNLLSAKGVKIIDETFPGVHVSGHPHKEEIINLYSLLKPEVVVPIHGETIHMKAHSELAISTGVKDSPIINNGDVLRLYPRSPEIVGKVPNGRLAIDGGRLISIKDSILRSRKKLLINGSVFITLILDKNCKLFGDIKVTDKGVFRVEDSKENIDILVKSLRKVFRSISNKKVKDDDTVIERISTSTRKIIFESYGKKPQIEVHLIRV